MRRRIVLLAVTLTLFAGLAGSARADVFNALGRYLGVGWSDGYHARDGCCPGPVWALRKGNTHPSHGYGGPAFVPYFETLPPAVYQPLPPTAHP